MQIVNYLSRCINGRDGRFSSASSGMILTAFCLVFIIVNAPRRFREFSNSYWVLEGFVLILGVLSSIVLWISVLKKNRRLRNDLNIDLTRRIKIVFLWIFGLLCIIMACYDLAVNFDCLFLQKPHLFEGQFELGIATHSFKVLFYLVQLGFLSSFAGHAIVISIIQNYMISWIILTHLVIWFMNLYRTMHWKMHPEVHNETTVQTNHTCFFQPNNQVFRYKLNPFSKPAITEFSLLAAELLMMMWIYSSSDISYNVEEEFDYVTGVNETTFLIQEPIGNNSRISRRKVVTNSFYICILIGTVLSLPFVVSSVVILYSEQSSFKYYEAFIILLLIFYIEHFVLILVTFVQVQKFSQWRDIRIKTFSKNKSILLVMTLTGAIVYSTLEILATIQVSTCSKIDKLDTKIRVAVFMKTLFEMITMFLQTLLIRQSWHMEKCSDAKKIQTIKRLFGILCLINLVIWLVFSVLYDTHTRMTIIEECFYGKEVWYHIRDGVFPITVFYRFHAAMHFYERCRKYH